jgi:4-diphosphocytidyl-2-C-methyl-D-erythritol kinase
MLKLRAKAYAKLNLTLEILNRREDGFHEIRTILQTINLWDTLSFEMSDSIGITCDIPDLNGEANIAYQAVALVKHLSKSRMGVDISIKKGIPIAAGLGGGSSDAAISLQAVNKLWKLGLNQKKLEFIASEVGSDVSYFLYGGTSLASGKGEQITRLPDIREKYIFLVSPKHLVSGKTPLMYKKLEGRHFTSGNSVAEMARGISADGTLNEDTMMNTFEAVAFDVFPGLADCRNAMENSGITNIHLSGTGPSLFSIGSDWERMAAAKENLQEKGIRARIVKPISSSYKD